MARDAAAADGDDRKAAGRFLHARDEGLRVRLDAQLLEPVDEALDIFRPGQPLAEAGKAEAVVNALKEIEMQFCQILRLCAVLMTKADKKVVIFFHNMISVIFLPNGKR